MDSQTKSLVFSGVGGQGNILASKVLSGALVSAGYDVKMAEVKGMAQRGGSVTTQLRFGAKVHSPIVGQGQADIIVAFEKMEGLRVIGLLKPEGLMIVNDYAQPPLSLILAGAEYPGDILARIAKKANTKIVAAAAIADAVGNPRTRNMVMLGALIRTLGLEKLDWEAALRARVKASLIAVNLAALQQGMAAVS